MNLINVSDELVELSKDILKTIEDEDREYEFKQNKGYVERNVPAFKFRKNLVGLNASDINDIVGL